MHVFRKEHNMKIKLTSIYVVTLLALLLGVGCARHEPEPTPSPEPIPVIIDTDMALDDWLAILYLLNRPDVRIKAITVTEAGEAHCDPGVSNVLKLIRLAGKKDIPVACGRETPLAGDHTFPQEWRDFVDSLAGKKLPEVPNPAKGQTATALLKSILEGSDQKVTLLTLGPLTNIADLLRDEPQLKDLIQMVFIMGGAIKVPGNVGLYVNGNESAEFNLYIDPLATSEVFSSGVPITLVPLDATNQVPVDIDFYNRLESEHPKPEATFVFDVLTGNLFMIENDAYYFWDPLAAAILADETLATYEELTICVDTTEGPTSGRTHIQSGCPIINVVTNVDKQKFEDNFLEVLNSP
jgi:pyrimidine-specific ribonucleoside hydrolase